MNRHRCIQATAYPSIRNCQSTLRQRAPPSAAAKDDEQVEVQRAVFDALSVEPEHLVASADASRSSRAARSWAQEPGSGIEIPGT